MIEPMTAQRHQVGAHEVQIEDGIVLCRYHGAVNISDIIAIHRLLEEQLVLRSQLFQVCDLRDMGELPSNVRAWIANWSKTHHLTAVVFFGASLLLQVGVTMIERVVRVLHRTEAPLLQFFRTEAEAYRWAHQYRLARSPTPATST